MTETTTITIHILDKPYPVKCPENQVDALQQSALYLDKKMRESAIKSKQVNIEQLCIMTALNIAHELLQAKQGSHLSDQSHQSRITILQQKIDDALTQQEEIEL